MLTLAEVKEAMLAKLSLSLLDERAIAKLKFKPLTAEQVKAEGFTTAVAGFLIPYFDINGKQTKFKRLRYVEDTRKGFDKLTGRKALRYTQLAGTVNEAYFPPLLNWVQQTSDVSKPLVITEGELKAACACSKGIPTIGLGGVWCFKSTRKGQSIIGGLLSIEWSGRRVFICYDSDAATNPSVVAAENMLASELTELGADVQIARLPAAGAEKVGIDDFLMTHEVAAFKEVLEKAIPFEACKALHKLNESVVYIRDPGLVYDYKSALRTSVDAFTRHAYANVWHDETTPAGKLLKVQTATKWLQWSMRSELKAMTFAPGEPKVTKSMLNTWDGWEFEPCKGDVKPWKELLDHIFQDAEKGVREWFEQWCAYPIQHPGYKMASGVLVWGVEQGIGKTLIGHTLMRLYGRYSTEVKDADLESSDYSYAEDKQFVLADDITGQDNRKLKRKLMTMITQKEIHINIKFVPKYSTPDCINYYFTANDPDAFYMDDGDRRFFIHEVTVGKLPEALRDRYKVWKSSQEGMQALMYYLSNLDLKGFDPDAEAYKTIAKATMIGLTKGDLALWVHELKENPNRKLKLDGDLFTSKELLAMYDPTGIGKVTINGMARELTRSGFRPPGKRGSIAITCFGNVRLWAVRNPEFWAKQPTNKVVEHYEANRVMVPVGMAKRVKYAGSNT